MWCIKNQSNSISIRLFLTRREAIADWIKDSGATWEYWHRKFNHRAVKVLVTIEEITKKNNYNMKPFDLKSALAGAKVVTRDGMEIGDFGEVKNPKGWQQVYGLLYSYHDGTHRILVDKNGRYNIFGKNSNDLFMAD